MAISSDRTSPRSLCKKEIDCAYVQGDCLIETVLDPGDPWRTALATLAGKRLRTLARFRNGAEVLFPLPRWKFHEAVSLPAGVKGFGRIGDLAVAMMCFLKRRIFLQDDYLRLLTSFVVYSYVYDQFSEAPYLAIIGPPQSGKTTLAKYLQALCHRGFLLSDISAASILDAYSEFVPTLLIDDLTLHGDAESERISRILRMGSTRGPISYRGNRARSVFGPKVLCGTDLQFDAALRSRCIFVAMTPAEGIPEIGLDCDLTRDALEGFRRQLTLFRLSFKRDRGKELAPVLRGVNLRPRSREFYYCLSTPLVGHPEWPFHLARFLEENHDGEIANPYSTLERHVLAALFNTAYLVPTTAIKVGLITEVVNKKMKRVGEKGVVSARKVGGAIARLGFRSRERVGLGCLVVLFAEDRKRIGDLAIKYASEFLDPLPLGQYQQEQRERATSHAAQSKRKKLVVSKEGRHGHGSFTKRK